MQRQDRGRPAFVAVLRLAVVVTSLLVMAGATGTAEAVGVQAPQRHAVVVSDSILLGAQAPLTQRLQGAGWTVDFDGAVSRSTLAGAEAIRGHGAGLTDTLIVSLGANDSGNPSTFRQRVDAVMAAASQVPNVQWLTIREVRPYYGPANQVLRDAAARYPNLHVVDWNAATVGRTDLTGPDGLHLNGRGAALMADLMAGSVMGVSPVPQSAVQPGAAPQPAAGTRAAADPGPEPAAVPSGSPLDASAPSEVPVATPAATSPSFDRMWLVAGMDATAPDAGRSGEAARDQGDRSKSSGSPAWLFLIVLAVVALAAVALAVVSLAVVALVRSRSGRASAGVPRAPGPAMTRAQLRAARISDARGRHPTTATVPPVPEDVDVVYQGPPAESESPLRHRVQS